MKCPNSECGGILIESRADWHYRECGLSNVILRGMPVLHCLTCEHRNVVFSESEFAYKDISRELLLLPRTLLADEMRFLQEEMRLRDSELSFKMKRSLKEVRRWLSWKSALDPISDLRVRLLGAERIFCEPEAGRMKDAVLRMFRTEYQDKSSYHRMIFIQCGNKK